MSKTPQKYKDNRTRYARDITSKLTKYKDTYPDYMKHVDYQKLEQVSSIDEYCTQTANAETNQCSNLQAKQAIDEIITNMRNDIKDITGELKNLGTSAQTVQNKFNNEELEYATEQRKLKNIKQKNAESIMMKKITEDNQAINIVESIYLVAGISFMGFFIWKQLNK